MQLYQYPPPNISNLVDVKHTPSFLWCPNNEWIIIAERPSLPPIEQLAQDELKLAGHCINPVNSDKSRITSYVNIHLQKQSDNSQHFIQGLPQNPKINNITWSPDGKKVAFLLKTSTGVALWYVDIATKTAQALSDATVNNTFPGIPYYWFPNSQQILYKGIVNNRGIAPSTPRIPKGPIVQESQQGNKTMARTYQNLLQNTHDEALFSYYFTSQLYLVSLAGKSTSFGKAGLIRQVAISPNGAYVLVKNLHAPFSYQVPSSFFPHTVEVWNAEGALVNTLANLPLTESAPPSFASVRKGRRNFMWRSDVPATVYWVEALDDGDATKTVDFRDQIYYLSAPFTQQATPSIRCRLRFGRIQWGNSETAIIHQWWWANRQEMVLRFRPTGTDEDKKLLYKKSWEDIYTAPGNFLMTKNKAGKAVLLQSEQSLFLKGMGASPKGNRPFIDAFSLTTHETTRLWQSEEGYYEVPSKILTANPTSCRFFMTRQSKTLRPNYYACEILPDGTKNMRQISAYPHPYPNLKGVQKQQLHYKRNDGVDLSANLYLPPNYNPETDGPLPVLMWAYPREYKNANLAGQVKNSPHEFLFLWVGSPIYLVAAGYAVLDQVSMPIIGEGDAQPNDTYKKQLLANAEAAIDNLVTMGVADPKKIAIGGHSYGAFMTANLLAHSNLFAAGIARSGAYNRTLTPFGFQSEERTLWEATDIYMGMSPFMHAHKINTPLLLIHGQDDPNTGTYPMQSERFFQALKGHGATTRLVMLPHEGHGYLARESVLHTLWEMYTWLEKYVR